MATGFLINPSIGLFFLFPIPNYYNCNSQPTIFVTSCKLLVHAILLQKICNSEIFAIIYNNMDNLLSIATSRLHSQGGRMTPQRRMILLALDSLNDHPTAEELFHQLHINDPTLHLSTVYRTLRWLEQEGLVQGCPFNAGRHTERFDSSTSGDHHHFICKSCGTVIEFELPIIDDIKQQYELSSSAMVENAQVLLYGICPECQP